MTAEELTTAFMHGMALRNGVIVNSLLPHKKAVEAAKPKGRKSLESLETPERHDPPREPSQQPPTKKAKVINYMCVSLL